MKIENEFDALVPAFHKAINGKSGDDFMYAIINFAMENAFETPTISILYKSDTEQIHFITDHPLNDIGFVFYEQFGGKSCFFVGSKKRMKADIDSVLALNELT